MTYGRRILPGGNSRQIMVAANLHDIQWKHGGVTIDWSTVTAATSDTTLPDGNVIPSGGKGMVFGTILCRISASDKYGPYNSGASDGRQTVTRGQCYILNESALFEPPSGGMVTGAIDHPAVFEGGSVWLDRLQIDGSGTATKPSTSVFNAAFPGIRFVDTDY